MSNKEPYANLMILVYFGLFEAVVIGIAFLCIIWLIVANHLQYKGKTIAEKYFRIPQKLAFFCSIAFMVSFGLCSAWVFLSKS